MENEILTNYKNFLIARKQSINYFNIMRIFFAYLEAQKIDYKIITQEIITNFINSHPEYEKRTLTQFVKSGRHFYTQFLQVPKEQNEWYKIAYYKGHKTTPKFITPEELKEIIRYFCTYENRLMPPNKAKVFIRFVYMTGLRKAELLNLKRTDINLNTNPCEIRVVGKGDKERFIYFAEKYSPNLKQELMDYFSSEIENINCFNMTIGKINYFFRKMNKYLPDRKISEHIFRHSFGKYLNDKGVPLTHIQNMLGHCLEENTRIVTPIGIYSAKELYYNNVNRVLSGKLTERNNIIKILKKAKHKSSLLEITTEDTIIKCSPLHKLFVWDGEKIIEKPAQYLQNNDYLLSPKKINYQNHYTIGTELARLVGYYMGDGCYSLNSITITDKKKEYIDYYFSLLKRINNFNLQGKIFKRNNAYQLRINSFKLTNYFSFLNINVIGKKRRLNSLLSSLPKEEIAEVIAGFFDAEGHKIDNQIVMYNTNVDLLKDFQLQLLRFGIRTKIYKKENTVILPQGNKFYRTIYTLSCYKRYHVKKFLKNIPILAKLKVKHNHGKNNFIPLNDAVKERYNILEKQVNKNYLINLYRNLERNFQNKESGKYIKFLVTLFDKIYFSKIIKIISLKGTHDTYDFELSFPHRFITDSIYSHNSSIQTTMIYLNPIKEQIQKSMI